MIVASRFLILICGTAVSLSGLSLRRGFAEETERPVSYRKDILPIFRANCLGCHQQAKPMGSYVMTDFSKLLQGGESGEAAVVSKNPDASHLLSEIAVKDGKAEMPKGKAPLHETEIALIRRWVAEGANDDSVAQGPEFTSEHPPQYAQPPVVTSVDVSPDGTKVAVAGFHEILVFDTATWQRTHRLIGMSPRVESVRFSPDGARLAATAGRPGVSGEVQVWNIADGSLLLSQSIGYDTLFGCSWSPDGKMIAFGSTENVVRAIDSQTGERRLFQGAHDDWPRATVFSVSSEHLLSAGRDMTVKLTEVATERFIDNVTSITPGVLRGGINALARHPQRDEILVGGSDGSPKIYRIFRQTARVIGDDANLVQKLPDMPGRIFSVAISPDAKYLAAASTLDGQSQVRVWKYDMEGQVPEDIRAIQSKLPQDRSADEKKKIEAYATPVPADVATWNIENTAIYAVSLDHRGRLFASGSDGQVRVYDCGTQQPLHSFDVTPSSDRTNDGSTDSLAKARLEFLTKETAKPLPAQAIPAIDVGTIVRIEVAPATIELSSWNHYAQMIVRGFDATGNEHDVTRLAKVVPQADLVWVNSTGWIQPKTEGETTLQVSLGAHQQAIPVKVTHPNIAPVDFVRDVAPALSRLGCNQGTCHGAQAGKAGFKLSLRGYDPIFDVRALTDDMAARRVNVAAPHESLMLAKPLGLVPHEGGQLMREGDAYATVIEQWIRDGAKLKTETPRVTGIEISPLNPVSQQPGVVRQLRVTAKYADGTTRDVTREAFIESGNTEVATIAEGATVVGVRRGEAPLLARFEGAYAATTLTVMGNRDEFRWTPPQTWNKIDELVASKWERMKIQPSELCTDVEFLRRVYLDLVGLPPSAEQVRAFLYDPRDVRTKRQAIIEQLLVSEEFVDHWTNKWSDLLQVNSKFLGKEGATGFKDWIRAQVASNRPYDQFVRDIVTASGSNRENPPASYYKILRTPEESLENTTHLFLAVRFNCNKCHDHPFERWTQDQYYTTAAYFAQVGLKKDEASGDRTIGGSAVEGAKPLFEEVYDTGVGEMKHQRTAKDVAPKFPYDCQYTSPVEPNRRKEFGEWLTSRSNPYFAKSYVNRLWGYLLGTGLIEPLDDIRAGNPASNPELLAYLEAEFLNSNFDVKHVLRLICQSRAYQLSVESNAWNSDDDRNYSHAKARRLPAEVLYDAVHRVTGTRSKFPGQTEGMRAASLADADAGLPDGFLNNLGRPPRESACECERSSDLRLGSIMALVSGPTIGSAIAEKQNDLHGLAASIPDNRALISEVFYRVLNRPATDKEIDIASQIFARIQKDHIGLVDQLKSKEAWWIEEKARKEAERLKQLEEIKTAYAAREVEIQPERMRLEDERKQRIAQAESNRNAYQAAIPGRLQEFLSTKVANVDWHPLIVSKASATNQATLVPQADRSIRADGNKDKGAYHVGFETNLNQITGIRLEALTIPEIPGGGPGLSANGNFVITEFELFAGPLATPEKMVKVKLAKGITDFDQPSFSAAAMIDGNAGDQGGWAIHDATGVEHWAVLTLEKPLQLEPGWGIECRIHQVHGAENHRLGRFRISVTTQNGDLPLGLSESLNALARTVPEQRSAASLDHGVQYFTKVDRGLKDLQAAVGVASAAVPPDQGLADIRVKIDRLEKPTLDDAALLRLRNDVQQSELQIADARVTAAEDLTWP